MPEQQAIETAQQAAKGVMAVDPVYGPIVVLLSVALLAIVFWSLRRAAQRDKEYVELVSKTAAALTLIPERLADLDDGFDYIKQELSRIGSRRST